MLNVLLGSRTLEDEILNLYYLLRPTSWEHGMHIDSIDLVRASMTKTMGGGYISGRMTSNWRILAGLFSVYIVISIVINPPPPSPPATPVEYRRGLPPLSPLLQGIRD